MKTRMILLKIDKKPSLNLQNGDYGRRQKLLFCKLEGTILAQDPIKGAKRKNRPRENYGPALDRTKDVLELK